MTRTITVTKTIGDAPYASLDRIFNRLTLEVTTATNITDKIFVVDATVPESPKMLYVATPADLTDVPDDAPNLSGLLRVESITVDYDSEASMLEFIDNVQHRITLLLETLNTLESGELTDSFTVTI